MAKTRNGPQARAGGGRPRAVPNRRRPQGRTARTPWYRRRETWGWAAAIAALAGLVTFGVLSARQGQGGSETQPFVGGDLHSLVVDPEDPSRLFVGGHEAVAVSTDRGRTWRPVESLAGADAMAWAFTDDRIVVGGHPGLYVSTDGGRTFEQRNEGLPATDIHGLGAGGGVVYASSPAAGVFASTDGGASWEMRTEQVGQAFMGAILVDPGDPDRLVAPDMQAGAVESTDGGRTWRALGGAGGAMWLSWDPEDTNHIVVSGMGEVARTTDGGRTWEPLTVPDGATLVEMDPTEPTTLYAAALREDGRAMVWMSRDGGETWSGAAPE